MRALFFQEFINNLLNMFHVQPMQVGILPDHLRNLPMTSVNDKQVEDKAQCAVCLEFYNIGALFLPFLNWSIVQRK